MTDSNAPEPPRPLRVLLGLALLVPYVGLALWAWGDAGGFFAHPARAGLVAGLAAMAAAAALARGSGAGEGAREDVGNRWVVLPLLLLGFLAAWLPPFTERRELWVFGGDGVRYAGLALFAAGGLLRVLPMYVLGERFNALVVIRKDHRLETEGLYRYVRHPSYLGGLLVLAGWSLGFRSLAGLLLLPLVLAVLIGRMNAEERLLESEFGEAYREYRRRSWRLVPFVY
jgi:protein-S-isoprenylcysteine O-methyltransferase Ste14